MFGSDIKFSNETDTHVTVSARVNEMAMYQFAKNSSPDVIVLSPQSLADRIKADANKTLEIYNNLKG